MASAKKYVDDIAFTTSEPDTLSMFLNSAIPGKAIIAHYQHLERGLPPRIGQGSPRYPRRPYEAIVYNANLDFADWTIANLAKYEAGIAMYSGPQLEYGVDSLEEIFVGRWLRTRPRPATPPLVRPRAFTHLHSQKRYKPGPFGELRRAPSRSFVGSVPKLLQNIVGSQSSPPNSVTRTPFLHPRETPTTGCNRELHTVGGVERILCHAAAFVAPCVYVFGGLTKNGCSDRMWSLLPAESGWRYVEPVGEQRPSSRYGHSLVAWRKQLVLFGGDGGPGYLDDLWYFDTTKTAWDRISLEQEQEGRRPGARTGHSAVVHHDKMIIFGGWRGGDGFSDVWACNLKERNWELLFYRTSGRHNIRPSSTEGIVSIENSAEMPEPRQWHICGIFGDYMYIHGGYGFGGVLRHVWRFSLPQRRWEYVATRGPEPAARCRHSGVVMGDYKWIVFGGKDTEGSYFSDMFCLDIRTHAWEQIHLFSPPDPMPGTSVEWWNCRDILRGLPYLHCQATAYDSDSNCIVVTGGCDGEMAAYDSTILIKRYSAIALLFENWIDQRPRRFREPAGMDLPEFLHCHPEPAAREILRFL